MRAIKSNVDLEVKQFKSALDLDAVDRSSYGGPMKKLKDARLAVGLTQAQLAELAGTTQSQINKLEQGNRTLSVRWAETLARHLNIFSDELVFSREPGTAPIVGYVGAGAEVFGERDDDPEYVTVPRGSAYPLEVVVVKGDSMFPVYRDGDRLIFEGVSLPLPEVVGKECIVQLEDGRKLVKIIGMIGGQYVLESFNAPPIYGVKITSAWPVKWIERR